MLFHTVKAVINPKTKSGYLQLVTAVEKLMGWVQFDCRGENRQEAFDAMTET